MTEIAKYTSRITSQHRDSPNFMAVVEAVVSPLVDLQNTLAKFPQRFDIDAAVGDQLDILGEWIGVSRYLSVPLTGVYFSLDDPALGFDQGNWKGPYDPDSGITRLDDESYRTLLRFKIAANHWDGTLDSMCDILQDLLGRNTYVFVQDNQDMTMTIAIAGVPPSAVVLSFLQSKTIFIKPSGVRVNLIVASNPGGAPIFGFDIQNQYISGFDTGLWGTSI